MSKPTITYDDFSAMDIVVAQVTAATPIEGADRLIKVTIDAGPIHGERTVVAGIKAWYQPEELEGKQVVYLANLEPRELYGVQSQGMLLAADDDGAQLLQPDQAVAVGSIVR